MKLLVVTGGQHPYEQSTPVLEEFLKKAGHDVEVTEDAGVLTSGSLSGCDSLVFNTLRRNETRLTLDERTAMTQFVGSGKGFVCIHISGALDDSWPEYHDVTGGGWIFGQSTHPPYGQFGVAVSDATHSCAEGITDFVTNDELYTKIGWRSGNHVFLTAELDGVIHPMAWTRPYGKGRVFATALGHNGLSFETPQFQRLVLNGVSWAGG